MVWEKGENPPWSITIDQIKIYLIFTCVTIMKIEYLKSLQIRQRILKEMS